LPFWGGGGERRLLGAMEVAEDGGGRNDTVGRGRSI